MAETTPSSPSSAQYQILLSLLDGEKHGYAIMLAVESLTDGEVRLGPGTLYGAIKRLIEQGWIAESGDRPDPNMDDERRRYYRLTGLGQKVVARETMRMHRLVRFAKQHLFA
jgi:DNA-binding PadR family transcriptional regulator